MAVAYPIGDWRNARGAQLCLSIGIASEGRGASPVGGCRRRASSSAGPTAVPCYFAGLRGWSAQTAVRDPTSSSMGAGTPIRGVAAGRPRPCAEIRPHQERALTKMRKTLATAAATLVAIGLLAGTAGTASAETLTATVRTRSRLPPRARPPARRSSRLRVTVRRARRRSPRTRSPTRPKWVSTRSSRPSPTSRASRAPSQLATFGPTAGSPAAPSHRTAQEVDE